MDGRTEISLRWSSIVKPIAKKSDGKKTQRQHLGFICNTSGKASKAFISSYSILNSWQLIDMDIMDRYATCQLVLVICWDSEPNIPDIKDSVQYLYSLPPTLSDHSKESPKMSQPHKLPGRHTGIPQFTAGGMLSDCSEKKIAKTWDRNCWVHFVIPTSSEGRRYLWVNLWS